MANARYLLFCDDDIEWMPGAIAHLCRTLDENPWASYAYGAYEMGGKVQCDQPFDADRLRRGNFVSTMSVIRREAFPGFDESIPRLQDWDLWLSMLEQGKTGVQCGRLIFSTAVRDGITENGPVTWRQARERVASKHGL